MTIRKRAKLLAFDACIEVAEKARLDRPAHRPNTSIETRRREEFRWKENNETIDQIVRGIKSLMRAEISP